MCLFSHFSRFKHILQPIADVCITNEQRGYVDFDSFFTHTICHECCHGIGPHTITLPNGKKSTVRLVSTINFLFWYIWLSLVLLFFLSLLVFIIFFIFYAYSPCTETKIYARLLSWVLMYCKYYKFYIWCCLFYHSGYECCFQN